MWRHHNGKYMTNNLIHGVYIVLYILMHIFSMFCLHGVGFIIWDIYWSSCWDIYGNNKGSSNFHVIIVYLESYTRHYRGFIDCNCHLSLFFNWKICVFIEVHIFFLTVYHLLLNFLLEPWVYFFWYPQYSWQKLSFNQLSRHH